MLPRELDCPPMKRQGSRDGEFRDVANLRHRAKHLRYHAKDEQRFVVSVIAYDSLPGHQALFLSDCITSLSDATPALLKIRGTIRDCCCLRWTIFTGRATRTRDAWCRTSAVDPGRVKTFFSRKNCRQLGVIHVDATV